MIKIRARYVLMLVLTVLVMGCNHDDEKPKGKFEHGAFIVNEGGFGSSNGSVSFYSENAAEVDPSILQSSTSFAGDIAQSITFKDDRGYLVLNGDNKIKVVDANTFEYLSSITSTDMIGPRYVEVINDKAYVSVWGPYDNNFSLVDSYVLVYDLKTNMVVEKINTDEGTENLLYNGNYLFATNYNYGGSNTLAVINPTDNTLVKQVALSDGPSGMVLDANGKLWVICSGLSSGKLYRINPSSLAIEVTITIAIANAPQIDLAISTDKQNILYAIGKSIYKLPITSTTVPAQPLLTASEVTTFYGFNINPDNDDIWVADAMNYSATGKTYIYTSAGVAKASFGVGINPGQFIFK